MPNKHKRSLLSSLLFLLLCAFMQGAQASDGSSAQAKSGEVHSQRTLQDDVDAIVNASFDGSFKGDENAIEAAIKDAVQNQSCTFRSLVLQANQKLQLSSACTFAGDDRDDNTNCGENSEHKSCHEVNLYLFSGSPGGSLLDSTQVTFLAQSILQGDIDEIAQVASDGSFKGDDEVIELAIEDVLYTATAHLNRFWNR